MTTAPKPGGPRRSPANLLYLSLSTVLFALLLPVTCLSQTTGFTSKIQHIGYMLQENRSFDTYFGRMGQYRANRGVSGTINGIPLSVQLMTENGQKVSPYHFQTVCMENMGAGWNAQHWAWDAGKMDNFINGAQVSSSIDPNYERPIGYYDWTDLPYYYELATQFATSDTFFASMMGPSDPNRMYAFAATSFGHTSPSQPPSGTKWTQPTIFDKLDAAHVTWKVYYQDTTHNLITLFSTFGRDPQNVVSIDQYFADAANNTLPQVFFVERAGAAGLDEHPSGNVQKGAANTKNIIDALMASPAWSSTIFVLTYDEAGGAYDHVPPYSVPPPDNIPPDASNLWGDSFNHSGMRLPVTVISPWVKPHFVSHINRETTSILKLIETRFSISPLTSRDAAADNMLEFFDFSPATPPLLAPPSLPSQPTNGACSYSLELPPSSPNPPPTISFLSPTSGTSGGGTVVTITGSGFQKGVSVFFGGTPAAAVTLVSSSSVKATTPAHAAGAVDVVVTNSDSQSATLAGGYTFTSGSTANPPPTVTGISPNTGPITGGTNVTITGTGFASGATVIFGSTAASNVVTVNGTTITATTPAASAGTVAVTVKNPDGQSGTLNQLLNPGYEAGGIGWVSTGNGTASLQTNSTNAHTGSVYADLTSAAGQHAVLTAATSSGAIQYFSVVPGQVATFGGWANRVSGDGLARPVLALYDSNKANPTYVIPSPNNVTTSGWTQQQRSYTVPTGKAFARFYVEIYSNTVPAEVRFDDTFLSLGFTYQ